MEPWIVVNRYIIKAWTIAHFRWMVFKSEPHHNHLPQKHSDNCINHEDCLHIPPEFCSSHSVSYAILIPTNSNQVKLEPSLLINIPDTTRILNGSNHTNHQKNPWKCVDTIVLWHSHQTPCVVSKGHIQENTKFTAASGAWRIHPAVQNLI